MPGANFLSWMIHIVVFYSSSSHLGDFFGSAPNISVPISLADSSLWHIGRYKLVPFTYILGDPFQFFRMLVTSAISLSIVLYVSTSVPTPFWLEAFQFNEAQICLHFCVLITCPNHFHLLFQTSSVRMLIPVLRAISEFFTLYLNRIRNILLQWYPSNFLSQH